MMMMDSSLLREKVILAPMVRGSELAFRTMMRRYGVRHCYSPMLRAAEVVKAFEVYKDRQTIFISSDDAADADHDEKKKKKNIDLSTIVTHEDGILLLTDIFGRNLMMPRDKTKTPPPSPKSKENEDEGVLLLTVQLCGCCPDTLYAATRILMQLQLEEENIELLYGIDLNLGCPQKCALDGCFGAFLAENQPELAFKCIAAMRCAIDSFDGDFCLKSRPRLSCKIRLLGSDEETINFAQNLERAGCEILALHCRHRIDKHHGKPDLEAGKKVVDALSIPVVINGSEINCLQDVVKTLEKTRAHSVMIARAFLSNPQMLLHMERKNVNDDADPAFLAAEYLDCCERHPPPSALYIQKHLRWIFRKYLQPAEEIEHKEIDYNNWRVRLWTFLVRPYLETIYQFRQVVVLYVKLNRSSLPESLKNYPEPSFRSIRHYHGGYCAKEERGCVVSDGES